MWAEFQVGLGYGVRVKCLILNPILSRPYMDLLVHSLGFIIYLFIYIKKKMVKESNHVTSLLGYCYSCYLNPGGH